MPDTPHPEPAPDAHDDATVDTTSGGARSTRRRRRTLPVGPLGMLAITAVALAAALGAGALAKNLLEDDPVPIQQALDSNAPAPRVANTSIRAEIGSPAPDVRLEYLDGDEQQLAEVAGTGTPVVLNFWSSTCVPCLKEMPAFEEVSSRYADEVIVLGVDVIDTADDGRAMVEQTGVTYRNARDPKGEIFAVYGGIALPRTVVIGADGRVLDTHSGELTAEELTGLLAEHDLIAT